jgi:hypothetical protein
VPCMHARAISSSPARSRCRFALASRACMHASMQKGARAVYTLQYRAAVSGVSPGLPSAAAGVVPFLPRGPADPLLPRPRPRVACVGWTEASRRRRIWQAGHAIGRQREPVAGGAWGLVSGVGRRPVPSRPRSRLVSGRAGPGLAVGGALPRGGGGRPSKVGSGQRPYCTCRPCAHVSSREPRSTY